jgi:hypothetical protein
MTRESLQIVLTFETTFRKFFHLVYQAAGRGDVDSAFWRELPPGRAVCILGHGWLFRRWISIKLMLL